VIYRRPGLTLLEILVVVGIISLLLSLLIPSLAGSKRAVKRLVCKSNLKSIARGIRDYAEDYGTRLPPSVQTWSGKARRDIPANVILHRPIRFNMATLLGAYVPPATLICPEPETRSVSEALRDANVAYSNYLFLWNTLDPVPEQGYKRIDDAPPAAPCAVDLLWTCVEQNLTTYRMNHTMAGDRIAVLSPFPKGTDADFAAREYLYRMVNLPPTGQRVYIGLAAGMYDGSVRWVSWNRYEARTVSSLDQSSLNNTSIVLPAWNH
jgi:prepilin-type N-terminal cleavage/methylation domain-containing protein